MNIIERLKTSFTNATRPYRKWLIFNRAPVIKARIKSHASYSGRYVLTIEPLDMGKGVWEYTRGIVKTKSGKKIVVVARNYSSFPFAFVEHHEDGHDYLICGENYQGQTIIQLDTGKRVDYLPSSATKGHGFCWANIYPSPDGKILAVEGCYWAAPYEIIFYDFSKPMMLPFVTLDRDTANDEFLGWVGPNEAKVGRTYEVSVKYGKREHGLTDEERDIVDVDCDNAHSDEEYAQVWKEMTDEIVWKRPEQESCPK